MMGTFADVTTDPASDPAFDASLFGGVMPTTAGGPIGGTDTSWFQSVIDGVVPGSYGSTAGSFGGGITSSSWLTPFASIFKSVPTLISAASGQPYTSGPQGSSGGYMAYNPAASSASSLLGTGGISTTTLLIIGAIALFAFMKK
jgi:hypothetical protein